MAIIKSRKRKKISISTSPTEIQHLLISWISIAIIFAILIGAERFGYFIAFLVSAITVGLGFLCHETAHKLVAQKYGCFAEYRADFPMLMVAVLMAIFLKFAFIAPGAVWIHGNVTRESNGKISAAGPATNFVLAAVFLLLGLLAQNPFISYVAATGVFINAWLGLFNMIPFWIFDGAKILRWNVGVYAGMVVLGIGFILLRGFIL